MRRDIKLLPKAKYFSTELIIDTWNKEGKLYKVPFYRIINKTQQYFSIEGLIEPLPTMKFKVQSPKKYNSLMECPQFLIIKATLKIINNKDIFLKERLNGEGGRNG